MDAGDERAAVIARGLHPAFERGQAVECPQLVEQKPQPQVIAGRQAHQCVDRAVEPQGEQLAADRQVDVARRDEQDRPVLRLVPDPLPDREARSGFGQIEQRLGVDVKHREHRMRHPRGIGRGQRSGDGVLEHGVDSGKIGGHQTFGQRLVGALTAPHQLDAHCDENRPRALDPELFGPASVVGHQRVCGVGELGRIAAFIEDAPARTTRIERMEDCVARGVEIGGDIGPGQIEHDRAMAASADLVEQVHHRHGLARAGRADEHRVGLLLAPRPGHPGEAERAIDAGRGEFLGGRQAPAPAHGLSQFARAFGLVVLLDLGNQFGGVDEACAALVTGRLRALAEPHGIPIVAPADRGGDEQGEPCRAPQCSRQTCPCLDHRGEPGDPRDRQLESSAQSRLYRHMLGGIELHEGPH